MSKQVKRYDIEASGLKTASGDPVPGSVVSESDYDALAQRCCDLEADIATLNDGLRQAALIGAAAENERDALRTEVARLQQIIDSQTAAAQAPNELPDDLVGIVEDLEQQADEVESIGHDADLERRAVMVLRTLRAEVEAQSKEAKLFRQLRDLPDELLGAPGVPCVAVPEGPRSGRYVSGTDFDAAMGQLRYLLGEGA